MKDQLSDPFVRELVNMEVQRELTERSMPTKYVGYLDMLGFKDLVKENPGSLLVDVDDVTGMVISNPSESAETFSQFHWVLDNMSSFGFSDFRPEQFLIFSDCAFVVFNNPGQAAVFMCKALRSFFPFLIPVRMSIAKGTCHSEGFSVESSPRFQRVRSMFYGSAIVHAVEAEHSSGRGCRIFLHASLDPSDMQQIKDRVPVLDIESPKADKHGIVHSRTELNYLHRDEDGYSETNDLDIGLWALMERMRQRVPADARENVKFHYEESLSRFMAMRRQLGRSEPRMATPEEEEAHRRTQTS